MSVVAEDPGGTHRCWFIVDKAQGGGVPMPAAQRTGHLVAAEVCLVIGSATLLVSGKPALA
jgi:hypothetical protein